MCASSTSRPATPRCTPTASSGCACRRTRRSSASRRRAWRGSSGHLHGARGRSAPPQRRLHRSRRISSRRPRQAISPRGKAMDRSKDEIARLDRRARASASDGAARAGQREASELRENLERDQERPGVRHPPRRICAGACDSESPLNMPRGMLRLRSCRQKLQPHADGSLCAPRSCFCQEAHDLIRYAQALSSHSNPQGNISQVLPSRAPGSRRPAREAEKALRRPRDPRPQRPSRDLSATFGPCEARGVGARWWAVHVRERFRPALSLRPRAA